MRKVIAVSIFFCTFARHFEWTVCVGGSVVRRKDMLGEMLEWLKRHAWKACKLQKGFRGSNPRLSAN